MTDESKKVLATLVGEETYRLALEEFSKVRAEQLRSQMRQAVRSGQWTEAARAEGQLTEAEKLLSNIGVQTGERKAGKTT